MKTKNNPTYRSWAHMKERCFNKNVKEYKWYGERGITVCKEWLEFKNFYEDMGDKPDELQLDRIDNNKGYYKNNCKWSTKKEQCNNRRDNIFVSVNGAKISFTDLAEMFGITFSALYKRLYVHKWELRRALTKPMIIRNL